MTNTELSHLRGIARDFQETTHDERNNLITSISESLMLNKKEILDINASDLQKMDKNDPLYDRVALSEKRIDGMATACHDLIIIADPLSDKYIQKFETESPIELISKPVPLGVVACIYEARPNVTVDLAILCIKSWNVCVLKWWSQASATNAYLRSLIQDVFGKNWFARDCLYWYSENREDLTHLLTATQSIDVIIPRWGKSLIDFVRKNALVPTIETGAGVVHIYIDHEVKTENFEKVRDIIINAKVSRPSVCNALDTLILHKDTPTLLIQMILENLKKEGVEIKMLTEEREAIGAWFSTPISEEDFFTEWLSLTCAIKVVSSLEEAINHIEKYSSHHSECIITDNGKTAEKFQNQVDSAVVYHNTSTRFSDGGCFGFGAEVGISTQKIHARGPMGCRALTTYKYFVDSDYSIRK